VDAINNGYGPTETLTVLLAECPHLDGLKQLASVDNPPLQGRVSDNSKTMSPEQIIGEVKPNLWLQGIMFLPYAILNKCRRFCGAWRSGLVAVA